jgi:predicted TIM-barrel fold metal-dependent hydrolase
MLTDFHTHIWPDALAPVAMSALSAEGGIDGYYDGTVAGLRSSMRAAGIGRSVVQPVATKPGQVRDINDWAATLASDDVVPFGAMHPDLADPVAELERMVSLGLRGFKMHPEYQSFSPDEPRLASLFDAAAELGLILFSHAGADIGPQTVNGTPEVFARLLDRYPKLTVVLAHMGGFQQWHDVPAHIAGRDVYLDTAYTLGHLADEEFVALVRAHGAERVLFGSDGPWTDPAGEIAHLRSMPFSDAELEAILGGTAARLLA